MSPKGIVDPENSVHYETTEELQWFHIYIVNGRQRLEVYIASIVWRIIAVCLRDLGVMIASKKLGWLNIDELCDTVVRVDPIRRRT